MDHVFPSPQQSRANIKTMQEESKEIVSIPDCPLGRLQKLGPSLLLLVPFPAEALHSVLEQEAELALAVQCPQSCHWSLRLLPPDLGLAVR